MTQLLGSRLDGSDLAERSWVELVARGLPGQFDDLRRLLSQRRGRRIRVFSTPMLDSGAAVAGLAVPLEGEDAIILDPCLLDHHVTLRNVVARELARTAYPGWSDLASEVSDDLEEFVSVLAPLLVSRRPRRPTEIESLIELAMDLVEAA